MPFSVGSEIRMNDIDIFISYRRLDSAIFSQWLAAQLRAAYGQRCVFIDTENIRDAEIWAHKISTPLESARVVIVVIGKSWLSIKDEHERRRIDLPDDWVRREIEISLRGGKTVIPLLIDGARLPVPEAIPESLANLLEIQARQVNAGQIAKDIADLVVHIGERLGKQPVSAPFNYPPPLLRIEALNEENLRRLAVRLPDWRIVNRVSNGIEKTELMRTYQFESFTDVIHFMSTAARFIDRIDHHPEWENVWRTLVVRLTTWDIGHRPSMLDVDLAVYLDGLFDNYRKTFASQDLLDIG